MKKQHLISCKAIRMDNSSLQALKATSELLETLENELIALSDADDYFNPLLESCQTANGALYDFLEAYYEYAGGVS